MRTPKTKLPSNLASNLLVENSQERNDRQNSFVYIFINVDAVVLYVPAAGTYRHHTQGTAPRHTGILDQGHVTYMRIPNCRTLLHYVVRSRKAHHTG